MRLTAKFQVPRVNFNRFRQALHENLSQSLAEAAKQWLSAVVPASTMEGIPVWSGASRATFLRLASYVEYVFAFAPVADAPDRIEFGLANGTGTFEMDAVQGIYRFSYSTTLSHLIINEYYNANTFINPKTDKPYFHLKRPGPYHFQEAGERAFRQFASGIELPGWRYIVDTTQLSVG